MTLDFMDVVTAFLNGELEEKVSMKQPDGYRDPMHPHHVCRLVKNLYGLKQAPRVWHRTVDPFIKSLGFIALDADPCIYYRWVDQNLSLIVLYIDNVGISCDSTVESEQI